MRIRQILWGLLLVVACGAASAVPAQPTNAAALVEPFLLRSGNLKIAGEVHRIGPHKCTALILVGGSNIRTRADTAQAVPIFLEPQTAVVVMDRRGNGLFERDDEDAFERKRHTKPIGRHARLHAGQPRLAC